MNARRFLNSTSGYNHFLLLVAGLGGLLYGVDVGIISVALPYLNDTSGFSAGQLSLIVAAVALGSLISTLFAGILSDFFGRKKMMIASGILFVASIPTIALAHGYWPLVFGRLLQGISAGLIGVVIPLYLAECLDAKNRGKGTGIFQWLLTFGIFAATMIGLYFSHRVDEVSKLGDAQQLFTFKEFAWRGIFWVSLPPGILFVLGSFMVAESPRWLFRGEKIDAARAALLRSRSDEQAEIELREMEETIAAEKEKSAAGQIKESLLRRKYVIPFLLACAILACNQLTGVNSIIGYNATILIQAGLSDFHAHLANSLFAFINFLVTIAGVLLVDRKGRKFLLALGTVGIIVSLSCAGILFRKTEAQRMDLRDVAQMMVTTNQSARITFSGLIDALNRTTFQPIKEDFQPKTLVVIYSYGDFHIASAVIRSDDATAKPIEITRDKVLPAKKFEAVMAHPFADYDAAKSAPLKIEHAFVTPIPGAANGWLTAICLFAFMAFFAVGPGVCVWLALSELMPTRIRSNGMSIALLINQSVWMIIAAVFLPTVGKYGYSTMFFIFAGCTVIYFVTATFFLPETKGKTLEEIEEHFESKKF